MAERQVWSLNQKCILLINDIVFHLLTTIIEIGLKYNMLKPLDLEMANILEQARPMVLVVYLVKH